MAKRFKVEIIVTSSDEDEIWRDIVRGSDERMSDNLTDEISNALGLQGMTFNGDHDGIFVSEVKDVS